MTLLEPHRSRVVLLVPAFLLLPCALLLVDRSGASGALLWMAVWVCVLGLQAVVLRPGTPRSSSLMVEDGQLSSPENAWSIDLAGLTGADAAPELEVVILRFGEHTQVLPTPGLEDYDAFIDLISTDASDIDVVPGPAKKVWVYPDRPVRRSRLLAPLISRPLQAWLDGALLGQRLPVLVLPHSRS